MNPGDVAPVIVMVTLAVCATVALVLRGPVGRALARRIEGAAALPPGVDDRLQDFEARLGQVEQERAELAERLDFAERVLARAGDGGLERRP
jgi:hypothetical protein